MSPWIVSAPLDSATRWLDESNVALRSKPARGLSTASGSLLRVQRPALEVMAGRASVSARLSLNHVLRTSTVAGQAQVSGLLGDVYEFAGSSSGTSVVTAETLVGKALYLEGASAGSSKLDEETFAGYLDVARWSYIDGSQDGDNWDGNAPSPVGRDDGPTRRRFSPLSIGRANES